MTDFVSYGMLALCVTIVIRLAVKAYNNKYAPKKTVTATVIDKSKSEMFSRYGALDKRYRYTVTFSAAGKRLSFFVSAVSYESYRLHTTGTLTYRGDRILDFH